MDIQYGQPGNLNWLWLVALLGVAAIVALVRHRDAMLQFATPNLIARIIPSGALQRNIVSAVLTLLALIAIVVGLVDIRWGKINREVPQKGIEVIFALDVSRSMLAEDCAPNRLERAKQDIKDMVDEMAGDRVGLVLFAGDVRRHIPLTNHYEDFKQSLDEVGPHNIDRGGSNLGEAIEISTRAFLEKTADYKAIVLFTDGEDHSSEPVIAATEARKEMGVRIFTVGLGSMDEGAPIPVPDRRRGREFIVYGGQQVVSKLDGETLEKIANVSEGAYIPAGTKRVDMAAVYHRFIAAMDQQDFETATISTYVARYPIFLGTALALLLLDILLSMFWQRKQHAADSSSSQEVTRAFSAPTYEQQEAA